MAIGGSGCPADPGAAARPLRESRPVAAAYVGLRPWPRASSAAREVRSRDEIGKVANAFNDMADRLLAANRARSGARRISPVPTSTPARSRRARRAQKRLSRTSDELRRSNQDWTISPMPPRMISRRRCAHPQPDRMDHRRCEATAGEDTIKNLALLHSRVGRLDMLLESLLQHSRVGRVGRRLKISTLPSWSRNRRLYRATPDSR